MSEDRIRELAYLKWEQAGYPAGDGVNFWLDAEKELKSATANNGQTKNRKVATPTNTQAQQKVAAKKQPSKK
jgi:hypothetical protein